MDLRTNRRRFLLQSVAATLALPRLPSLMAGEVGGNSAVQLASGAGAGARRFVAVGNLLGYQQKSFFPETAGKGYELTTLLKPLASSREHMTVYRGLDHGVRGGHFAVHSFLSGVLHHESADRPTRNVTIDQYIAESLGTVTRFPSLTVGSEGGIHGGCQMSWTKAGVRVPPITGPAELFEKLFVEESVESQAGLARRQDLQASILDSLNDDARRLSKRVNREDRDKLDEYLTSVRDVERRLQLRREWAGQPKPEAPFERPANTNTVEDLPLLYELIGLALQTDSTRVATLEIGGCFLPQNLGIDRGYHALSHHGHEEETIEHLITLETYQIEQFGKFLERLAKTEDGEGSLLDATTVLFGSGIGDGHYHTNTDLPIILAGGGYRHGEYKVVESKDGHYKTPLCNLFLDIAHRMGVESDSFGTSTGTYS